MRDGPKVFPIAFWQCEGQFCRTRLQHADGILWFWPRQKWMCHSCVSDTEGGRVLTLEMYLRDIAKTDIGRAPIADGV